MRVGYSFGQLAYSACFDAFVWVGCDRIVLRSRSNPYHYILWTE